MSPHQKNSIVYKREGLQLVKQIENCANQIESLIKKLIKLPFSIGCDVKENFVRLSEAFKETNIEKIISSEQKEGSKTLSKLE